MWIAEKIMCPKCHKSDWSLTAAFLKCRLCGAPYHLEENIVHLVDDIWNFQRIGNPTFSEKDDIFINCTNLTPWGIIRLLAFLLTGRKVWLRGGDKLPREINKGMVFECLGTFLNPLTNPLSPLAKSLKRRNDQIQNSYFTDSGLARLFVEHYLPREFWEGERDALDFGCGRGRIAAVLVNSGFRVTGLDVVKHPWWNRLKTAYFLRVGSEMQLSLADDTYDLVTHFQVIQYFKHPKPHLQEIRRILKPGGLLLIQVANDRMLGKNRLANLSIYFHPYRLEELVTLVTEVGFDVLKTWYEGWSVPIASRLVALLLGTKYAFSFVPDGRHPFDRFFPAHRKTLITLLARC